MSVFVRQISHYVQTILTKKYIIKRIWVELNHRVTSSVKRVIVAMDDKGTIDMSCYITKFAVSLVHTRDCEIGMSLHGTVTLYPGVEYLTIYRTNSTIPQ